ncbi:MAG: hypothetical protein IMZ53_16505 [Thermoplasmata archaeon]|nr:hypothetical protein [Thermoplasmata archaeon]MBE3142175.1 hypothetical protein [Thermoplasmata archaeon]
MSKLKCWKREDKGNTIRFRNKKDQSLTYEIRKVHEADREDFGAKYYHYLLVNGHSPDDACVVNRHFAHTKREAISEAQKYMKDHDTC